MEGTGGVEAEVDGVDDAEEATEVAPEERPEEGAAGGRRRIGRRFWWLRRKRRSARRRMRRQGHTRQSRWKRRRRRDCIYPHMPCIPVIVCNGERHAVHERVADARGGRFDNTRAADRPIRRIHHEKVRVRRP